MKSLPTLRSLVDKVVLAHGYVRSGKRWLFQGEDFHLCLELQKSNYDGQCWLNIIIFEPNKSASDGHVNVRLDGIFPEERDIVLSGLNIQADRSQIDELMRKMGEHMLQIINRLANKDELRKFYAAGLLKGAAISALFRENHLD